MLLSAPHRPDRGSAEGVDEVVVKVKVQDIEACVTDQWTRVFRAAPVPDTSFIAQGGDSLRAVKLSVGIQRELGVEIEFVDILNARSSLEIVHRVGERLQ